MSGRQYRQTNRKMEACTCALSAPACSSAAAAPRLATQAHGPQRIRHSHTLQQHPTSTARPAAILVHIQVGICLGHRTRPAQLKRTQNGLKLHPRQLLDPYPLAAGMSRHGTLCFSCVLVCAQLNKRRRSPEEAQKKPWRRREAMASRRRRGRHTPPGAHTAGARQQCGK
jgi:hypothetical protein